ncbi:MAG: cob(I)yrinic acid a,c-diamide adenosyltransferase [Sandaracinaceae bacterium]|nr:cob(I)yrinic acid a,c-diamide adenosyltransferase [Sandaracinaceae bacterium]
MKIYTKGGDAGETGLFGGTRISKASARVSAYGEVDELNSTLGVVRATGVPDDVDALLAGIQSELFGLGAELAARPGKKLGIAPVDDAQVEALEAAIDRAEEELEPLETFILPGGAMPAAQLHVARTVCRRAERAIVALGEGEVRGEVLRYVNRLSDLLFVLARLVNHRVGVPDVPWKGRSEVSTS